MSDGFVIHDFKAFYNDLSAGEKTTVKNALNQEFDGDFEFFDKEGDDNGLGYRSKGGAIIMDSNAFEGHLINVSQKALG